MCRVAVIVYSFGALGLCRNHRLTVILGENGDRRIVFIGAANKDTCLEHKRCLAVLPISQGTGWTCQPCDQHAAHECARVLSGDRVARETAADAGLMAPTLYSTESTDA